MTAIIEARGLSAGYGKVVIVRDLDLSIEPGEIVALLGPNGAGKTTTLMTLAGALTPLGGDVELFGRPTTAPLHKRVQSGLGVIGEERTVLMGLTVAENLRVCRSDTARALELFPELEAHLHRKVGLLSGGQQQMLALARVLSRNPSVILADELSLGLAPVIVKRLLQALRAAADTGVGVLLVEQHVREALAIADRVYVLQRGRVVLSGQAAEIADRVGDLQASYFAADAEHDPIESDEVTA
ncbi:MAG: transporter related protein [Subtercola sp.]|nr:transporter related protein [Subtercola sp.]